MMNIKYFKNIETFIKKERLKDKNYLFFTALKTEIDIDNLKAVDINFIGAVFPKIIYNNKLYEEGLIVVELNASMEILFIKDISSIEFDANEFSDCKSIISIVEGISQYNEPFLEKLFSSVAINTNIIGGGAGLMNNDENGVLFDKDGFYYDSAILIKIKNNITMGAYHGCEYLEGPYVATSSSNNVLSQIDYEDAFSVYKRVIKEDCNLDLNEKNFLEIVKNYPIGIVKYNNEQIARDPIGLKNGKLILAGNIKENEVLNILKVNKKSMLEASKKAASTAIDNESNLIIMFDCISREEYLKDSFGDELSNVSSLTKRRTSFGAITVGEIANSGNKYINFFNKTCVIGSVWI